MRALVGLMAVVLAAAVVPRAGRLQSLSLIPTAGKAELVMRVSGDVTTHDFVLKHPDKIVVDIYGATLGIPTGASYDGAPRGPITDVRYAQFNKTTVRVVLTLSERHQYKLVRGSGELRVEVEGKAESFASWRTGAPATLATVAPLPDAVAVERRVPPPSAPAPAPVHRHPETPVTPVANRQPSRQRPITISWLNTDIREVLAAFQEFSGLTIIPSKDVVGNVTANIVNQPWDVAMKALLHAYGYAAVEDPISGIITVDTEAHLATAKSVEALSSAPPVQLNYARAAAIAPIIATRLTRDCGTAATPAAAPAAAAPAAAPAATAPAGAPSAQPPMPGVTPPPGVSAVANAPAAAAAAAPLPISLGSNCPARGAVIADTVLNTINIVDIASNLDSLVGYARSLDLKPQQVNIRAKIVTIKRNQLDELGLQYSLGAHQAGFMDASNSKGNPRVDSTGNAVLTGPLVALGGNAVAAIANASSTVASPILQLVYSTAMGNYDLSAFLAAAHQLQLTDEQSEPSASVLNNRTAQLVSGTQVPIRTINLAGAAGGAPPAANVGFQQTGVILQVTPQITHNRQVQMKIHVESTSPPVGASDVGAQVDKNSVDNEVLVADGETAVMGGLTQTTVSFLKEGLPFFVDLPLIGPLFGHTQRQETKSELLILITPHIIDDGQSVPPDGAGSPR